LVVIDMVFAVASTVRKTHFLLVEVCVASAHHQFTVRDLETY